MYKVSTSEGLVLGKRGVGEENAFVAILTKDLGLIKASARAARRENSKLRYGLEPLMVGEFSFIRGRNDWRLTSGRELSHELVSRDIKRRQAAGRIIKLLSRLIHGEEVNADLYIAVVEGLRALAQNESSSEETIEMILVLRVLSHLGYVPELPELRPFVEQDILSPTLTEEVLRSRSFLIRTINESLYATGL